MNTATFDATVRDINKVGADLTKFSVYLQEALNATSSCQEIQALLIQGEKKLVASSATLTKFQSKVTVDIQEAQTWVAKNLGSLSGIMANPTDLPTLITWASNVAAMHASQYASLLAQEALLAAQLVRIIAALEPVLSSIGNILEDLNTLASTKSINLDCGGGLISISL